MLSHSLNLRARLGWAPSVARHNISSRTCTAVAAQMGDYAIMHEQMVPEGLQGRADELLPVIFSHLQGTSKTGIKRACRRGELLADGRAVTTSTILNPGNTVQIISRVVSSQQHLQHNQLPDAAALLQVVYEDEHIAVVIKPPGMPCQGTGVTTAQGLLPLSLKPNQGLPGTLRKPCHAHRLDALTGGLLLAAKTQTALRQLSADFAAPGTIRKRYVALVKGRLEGAGLIEVPLQGKHAATRFEVTQHTPCSRWSGCLTTVSLWPLTGRTHQLRRHMQHLGTPILGDPRYRHLQQQATKVDQSADLAAAADAECSEGSGILPSDVADMSSDAASDCAPAGDLLSDGSPVSLCLWAVELWLPHPVTRDPLHFVLPDPVSFEQVRAVEGSNTWSPRRPQP